MTTPTVRLTVGQAIVRFLARQYSERDGQRARLVEGCFGIFGHGNVAGMGQGLLQAHREARELGYHGRQPGPDELPYFMARNEQAMVHAAVGFARTRCRLQIMACTASIGPGSTNMVTGAALATIDRIPVLLLPSDVFARRHVDPVLQQLEHPGGPDVTVNDVFRPVSRYFDRIWRPEQLIASAPAAMRVLTDPAETGAVTLALPQDVQAEAFDWPTEFFEDRIWHIPRAVPEPGALGRAVAAIRAAERPLLVAGGGVIYSEAAAELIAFAEQTGIPVVDTQAGKGAMPWDHPLALGGLGATGSAAANEIAASADLVVGIGTRWTDFTTASHTVFADPELTFVNINVAAFDAAKHSAVMLVADARSALRALSERMQGFRTPRSHTARAHELAGRWHATVDAVTAPAAPGVLVQTEVLGVLNDLMSDDDILVNAAGSMPGDLQALWRTRRPGSYHLEYGYSCMGYEIPAAMGAKLAEPAREVIAIVGDGTYQMMPQEIATLVSEDIKVIIVLLDNGGYASIGSLSESVGSQRFATRFRERGGGWELDGPPPPVDLAVNAASFGAKVLRATTLDELRTAFEQARDNTKTTLIHVPVALVGPNPPATAWWEVPVSEVSTLTSTIEARARYEESRQRQRNYLSTPTTKEEQVMR